MGGKIKLKHSEKGLTIFNVKVPVEVEIPATYIEESVKD
jgi:hypothetical protein